MSVQRVAAPLTSSSSLLFRFASAPTTFTLQPSQHAFRHLPSVHIARMSSKRKMQTSTAYHPYSLDPPPPPPPRNAGVPETSIAGGRPQFNETRPPANNTHLDTVNQQSQVTPSSFGETEKEAQKPRSVQPSSTTLPSPGSAPQTRPKTARKLRPRKAAMSLTSGAVSQLRAMLDQPAPKLIKVGVRNRGCSGLAYNLEYVDKPGPFDEMVEQDGVKVLIDSKALFSIIGTEMDWVEDKLNQRFVFNNPNITEQCGCGESFKV